MDQTELTQETKIERTFTNIERGRSSSKNPFQPKYESLYGFSQSQMGLRAKSNPSETISNLPLIGEVLAAVGASIVPILDNTYDLGSTSKSWKGIYSKAYFDSDGNQLLMYKTIVGDTGSNIVADSLTDTLTITSSDRSILVMMNAISDTIDLIADFASATLDTSSFDNVLSAADDTVQKAFDAIDNNVVPVTGGTFTGDVTIGGEFQTNGDRVKSTETSTTTVTMSDTVEVHIANGTSTYTVTLPTHRVDKEIRIINKNTGVVTLSPTSGTIKGSATETLIQWESLILLSDGTDWL